MEDISLNTGIAEFDELQFYLNHMMENIRTNWDRISHIISKGSIPIGIFEQDMVYKRIFINDYMLHMLNIPADHTYSETELLAVVRKKLDQAVSKPVLPEELIYLYEDCGFARCLRIEKEETAQSQFYYVTDVSGMWDEIEQIRTQSSFDPLVNLYNRRGFQDKISELFQSPEQIGYAMVIILDADNLKAQRGLQFFSAHEAHMAHTVEFSLGVSFYPQESTDFHVLMRAADQKMYQEKKRRKVDRS